MSAVKKTVALLLCVMIAVAAAPVAAAPAGVRVSGVDYSELWEPDAGSFNADVIIGGRMFFGSLERESSLTDEEVDAILRKVLRFFNMTEGTLMACNNAVEKAKNVAGFSAKDIIDILMGLTGADTYYDIFSLVTGTGKKTSTDIAADIVLTKAVENGVKGAAELAGGKLAVKAATQLGGFAISTLVNAGKVSIAQYEKWSRYEDIISAAIEAQSKLDRFYRVANELLRKEDYKRGGEWHIRIDSNDKLENVSFMGIPGNKQTWHVWGDLEKENTSYEDPADPSGTYYGRFNIEVTHDLSRFDRDFYEKVAKPSRFLREFDRQGESFTSALAQSEGLSYSPPWVSYSGESSGDTDLSVLYHADELELEVNVYPTLYNSQKVNFLLSDMDRTPTFDIYHGIRLVPEMNVWSGGNIAVQSFSAKMNAVLGLKGNWTDNSTPRIDVASDSLSLTVSSFGESYSHSNENEHDEMSSYSLVSEDREILRDLRARTYFMITGGGR